MTFRLDGYTDVTGRSTDSAEEQRIHRRIDDAFAKVRAKAEAESGASTGSLPRLDSHRDELARGPDPEAARAAMIKRNGDAWKPPAPARGSAPDVHLDEQDDPNNPDPAAARAKMIERNANAWRR
jgi:hypothetical protein